MQINYSDTDPVMSDNSIFLAGPTPRKKEVSSWRPEALGILHELDFKGVVYVPERKLQYEKFDYLDQVEWERACLTWAGIIVFWVPRKLPDMPAFTTNVEFGRYVTSNRIVYGRPDWAEKKGYLDWLYKKETGKSHHNTLKQTLVEAMSLLKYKATSPLSVGQF